MDRETAKQLAIEMYEYSLNVYEGDDITFMDPCVGKCTQTYGELYDAAVADVIPDSMSKIAADDVLF